MLPIVIRSINRPGTITETIPVGSFKFLIFTIQQVVDNKPIILKNGELLIKILTTNQQID